MFLFKTSGNTYDSVIRNQKHAFRIKPVDWYPGEIVLVSKNKQDLLPGEKQIAYTMRLKDIRETSDEEIEKYWPGNRGRWNYLIECANTEPVTTPFNLYDVLGDDAFLYNPVITFKKIKPTHEKLIIPFLTLPPVNNY